MDLTRKIVVNPRKQARVTPTVLFGRASRFIPGRGRNTRGKYTQTDEELRQAVAEDDLYESDLQPSAAVADCAIALEEAQNKLQNLQRHHRERWVQHHLYMRRTTVWEEDVQQSTRSLRDDGTCGVLSDHTTSSTM